MVTENLMPLAQIRTRPFQEVIPLTASRMSTTHLYDWHVTNGAKMAPFAGFHMPLWYKTAVTEHLATRKAAGLFDVTHMVWAEQ